MNTARSFLLVLLVAMGGHSFGQTQSEMNGEAARDLQKADAELNRTYQKVLSRHTADKQFCADLKEAQRAWVKFVEYHLKTVFPVREGEDPRVVHGSIYPMEYAVQKTGLTKARTGQLKSLLDE